LTDKVSLLYEQYAVIVEFEHAEVLVSWQGRKDWIRLTNETY